jgi:hypothetical protein
MWSALMLAITQLDQAFPLESTEISALDINGWRQRQLARGPPTDGAMANPLL